jgi:hypothetical protein
VPEDSPAPTVEPWERQEGESEVAFLGFVGYRDQPAPRSLARLARDMSKSRQLVETWSSKNNWVRRASAYDRQLDDLRRQARRETIEAIERRQAEHLALAAETLALPVQQCLDRIQCARADGDDPFDDTATGDLLRLALAAVRMMPGIVAAERLIAGLSPEDGVSLDPEAVAHSEARQAVASMSREELECILLGPDRSDRQTPA